MPVDKQKKQELLAEIERIREEAVNDLTIKVGDERWRAAVARCRELRKQMGFRFRAFERDYDRTMRLILRATQ